MEKEEKDLENEGKESPEDESASKKENPEADDGLKNEGENIDDLLDDLLADGTERNKKIGIKKDKFDELNDKAKLYDSFSPILSKLQENPEAVDKLIGEQTEEDKTLSLRKRVEQLENEKREKKIYETREVIKEAIFLWGKNFTNSWKNVQPIVSSLEKQGLPYKDAVQRAYFAVNPEAIKEEKRLIERMQANEKQNEQGKMSSSSISFRPEFEREEADYPSDHDKQFSERAGAYTIGTTRIELSPKLYKKHEKYLRDKGLL